MRAIVFFLCLFSLLLGGGHKVHAHGQQGGSSAEYLIESQQAEFTATDHDSAVIELACPDLEEEYQSSNGVRDGSANKALPGKCGLPDRQYFLLSPGFIANHYHKYFKDFLPFSGHSSPLYLRLRVLRI